MCLLTLLQLHGQESNWGPVLQTMWLAKAITTYLCSTSCLATLYFNKMNLHGENAFPVYCSFFTVTYCKTFTSQLRHKYQQPCRVENLKISNLWTPRRGHDGAVCNFAQFLYAYGNCTHRGKLHTDKKLHIHYTGACTRTCVSTVH